MIDTTPSLLHWNYYLAVEADLSSLARYVEFSKPNFKTYSIEMVQLLLSSASEVDVVLKSICTLVDAKSNPRNIKDYRKIIAPSIPTFLKAKVMAPRYGLTLQPWSSWTSSNPPRWWTSHNQVKHHRNEHFSDANLTNTLNSVAALLISVFHFYKLKLFPNHAVDNREVTQLLQPESQLFQFPDDYYYAHLIDG